MRKARYAPKEKAKVPERRLVLPSLGTAHVTAVVVQAFVLRKKEVPVAGRANVFACLSSQAVNVLTVRACEDGPPVPWVSSNKV